MVTKKSTASFPIESLPLTQKYKTPSEHNLENFRDLIVWCIVSCCSNWLSSVTKSSFHNCWYEVKTNFLGPIQQFKAFQITTNNSDFSSSTIQLTDTANSVHQITFSAFWEHNTSTKNNFRNHVKSSIFYIHLQKLNKVNSSLVHSQLRPFKKIKKKIVPKSFQKDNVLLHEKNYSLLNNKCYIYISKGRSPD